MTDKEFVNLQRVGLTLGRPLTLPFLQCQLLNFFVFAQVYLTK